MSSRNAFYLQPFVAYLISPENGTFHSPQKKTPFLVMHNYIYLEVIPGSKWHEVTEFEAFVLKNFLISETRMNLIPSFQRLPKNGS